MSYISAKEAAQKWGISERMVYKYCTQNRIPEAYQDYGIWFIAFCGGERPLVR